MSTRLEQKLQELDGHSRERSSKRKRTNNDTAESVRPQKFPLLETGENIAMELLGQTTNDNSRLRVVLDFFRSAIRADRSSLERRRNEISEALLQGNLTERLYYDYLFEAKVVELLLNHPIENTSLDELASDKERLQAIPNPSLEDQLNVVFIDSLMELKLERLQRSHLDAELVRAYLFPQLYFGPQYEQKSLPQLHRIAKNLKHTIETASGNEFTPLLLSYVESLIAKKENSPIEIESLEEEKNAPHSPIEIPNLTEEELEDELMKDRTGYHYQGENPPAVVVPYKGEEPEFKFSKSDVEMKISEEINYLYTADRKVDELTNQIRHTKNKAEKKELEQKKQEIIDHVHVIVLHDEPLIYEYPSFQVPISRGRKFLEKYGITSTPPSSPKGEENSRKRSSPKGQEKPPPPTPPPPSQPVVAGISGKYSIRGKLDIEPIIKRKLSEWQIFAGQQLKAGKSLKEAGRLWRVHHR